MLDLMAWEWKADPPHDRWVGVLMHHDETYYKEAVARLNHAASASGRVWTLAPEHHLWGPVVAWRELAEGERP